MNEHTEKLQSAQTRHSEQTTNDNSTHATACGECGAS